VTVPKTLEPLVLVPLKDIKGRRGVITVTTIETKEQEILREFLEDQTIRTLGVISRYVGR